MSSTVSSALQARASEEYFCNNLKHCRTIWNIIWSSIATILSWTWLALHPNIPYPAETHNMTFRQTRLHEMRVFFRQRLPLFLLTLILPEYILAWAIRQRFVAREIAKETGWTTTHGFFIIMGGFHLFERNDRSEGPGTPKHPFDRQTAIKIIRDDKEIELPLEAEIQDKSKSDGLANTFVFVQSVWFIIQAIARAVANLPVTKLEIVTLAYIVINFTICMVWWGKPRNVNRPIRVIRKPIASTKDANTANDSSNTANANNTGNTNATIANANANVNANTNGSSAGNATNANGTVGSNGITEVTDSTDKKDPETPEDGDKDKEGAKGKDKDEKGSKDHHDADWGMAWEYVIGAEDDSVDMSKLKQVPTFYSGRPKGKNLWIPNTLAPLIGIVFGGIHCIAWSFAFPSYAEQILWRVTSLSIVGFFTLIALTFAVGMALRRVQVDVSLVAQAILPVIVALYAAGRLISLTIGFTTLRSLPVEAYQIVHWTNYIPHV